jgi:hypothetical protein
LGAVGGYFAASGLSALLQPIFGWRIMWLMNLPTGLILLLLGGLIPESAKFLMARGRATEAEAVMKRFGATVRSASTQPDARIPGGNTALAGAKLVGKIVALSTAAITWGFVNFGLLLWLPADLVAKGYSVGVSSKLLAESSLIAFPTVFVAAFLYSRWSTKWSLVTMIGVTMVGLAGVLRLEATGGGSPVLPVALLIVGSNGASTSLERTANSGSAAGNRGEELDAVGFEDTEAIMDERVANASLDRRAPDIGSGLGMLLHNDFPQFGDAAAFWWRRDQDFATEPVSKPSEKQ